MSIGMRAKRLTYLVHRWTGVAGCLLMVLWFISGVVMLYVGYPKLTPWERLGALPALNPATCCVPVDVALAHSSDPTAVRSIVLSSVRGAPHYLMREQGGAYRVVDARSGHLVPQVDSQAALDEVQSFTRAAPAHYGGTVFEDRWTHSRGLNAHRPLHRLQVDGQAPATLYVSSTTGQVVMDAPLSQQRWNYVGAWLHWLYMFRQQAVDPVWHWLVVVLSLVGTISAVTGICVGLWRWRFSGQYKSGSKSPYRAPWMRWHHIAGLLFAGFVFTWILSGLMSMNPLGVFDARGERPNIAAYQGGTPVARGVLANPEHILAALHTLGFDAVELEWRMLAGQPYVLARNPGGGTRLVVGSATGISVRHHWREADVMHAVHRLLPYPIILQQHMTQYDSYYYGRQPEAMNGAAERRLPALRLDFDDPGQTRVYVDLSSGDVALSLDRRQRVGRWLFNFLHSWDIPWMLAAAGWRDVALILLSLGGLLVSATGVVIAYRRLRVWLRGLTH